MSIRGKRILRVGIVGSGWVAQNRHLPSYRKNHRVRVEAIIDRRIQKAEQIAHRWNVPRTYTTLEEVDVPLDLVSICTPPFTHCDVALKCMERGWHVLVEKPMAMSVDEAELMMKAAEKNDVKLSVCHNFLFMNSMKRIKSIIERGELGSVAKVEILQISNLRRHLPEWFRELPGGLFFDEAAHAMYFARLFLGEHLTCTYASAQRTNGHSQQCRSIEAIFASNSGSAHLNMVFDAPRDEWLMTIVGSEAVVSVDMFRDTVVIQGYGGEHKPIQVLTGSFDFVAQQLYGILLSGTYWLSGKLLFGHDVLINRFVEAIEEDNQPPVLPIDGMNVVNMLCEVVQAAGLGGGAPI